MSFQFLYIILSIFYICNLFLFRIYFENPHGMRSIAFTPNECIVFIKGKVLKDGCNIEKWQLIKNENLILNSKDFGKYIVK